MAEQKRTRRQGSLLPWWIRHQGLVTGEALLLMGIVQKLIQDRVALLQLPNWGKVLWIMVSTLGICGIILALARYAAQRGVAKVHVVGRAVIGPQWSVILHLLAYGGLFLLYARLWNLPVW
jgi:hypothetical protein